MPLRPILQVCVCVLGWGYLHIQNKFFVHYTIFYKFVWYLHIHDKFLVPKIQTISERVSIFC
jgi:hypothetical protein